MNQDSYVSGENVDAAGPAINDNSGNQTGEGNQERQVPLDALQAERTERQKLQDEVRMLKDHMMLMQSSQQNVSHQKDPIDNLADDDVLTVGEAKKFINKLDSAYKTNIEELRMSQKYPDYSDVINKYLPEVIKQNPSIRNNLQRNPDYEMAYYLAKNSDAYKADHKKTKKNADAERIVQNANKAGSLSSMGQTSPINEARRYKDMSDSDFKKLVNQNIGQF